MTSQDDLAVLHPEDVDNGTAAVVRAVGRMDMQPDKIAVRRTLDDLRARPGVLFEEAGEAGHEWRFSVRNLGVVLFVVLGDDRRAFFDVVFVKEAVMEIDDELSVRFVGGSVARG